MYHTYTICSRAEERSRGRVLDPISMSCRFEPHLKHCVVFLNITLSPQLSTGFPPIHRGGGGGGGGGGGYCFGVGRLSILLSACLSVHMSFQKQT